MRQLQMLLALALAASNISGQREKHTFASTGCASFKWCWH
jgi:hypothetical protein